MSTAPRRLFGQRLRSALAERPMLGGWCASGSLLGVDALAAAGFDWIGFDSQHGLETRPVIAELVRAANSWNLPAIVRIPWGTPDLIMGALDAGATGIIVPLVEDAVQARGIANWSRFPPQGSRSWGPMSTLAAHPGLSPQDINDDILVFVMIESQQGYLARQQILAVDGVDGVFVGPADLSISRTGTPHGTHNSAQLDEALRDILETTRLTGTIPGYSCDNGDQARRHGNQGYRFMPVGSDFSILKAGARHEIDKSRSTLPDVNGLAAAGIYGA